MTERRKPASLSGVSQRHYRLCEKAEGNWPVGADYFVLSEDEEAFARAHSPALVKALWEAYERQTKAIFTYSGRLICALCGHEKCEPGCPVWRINALTSEDNDA